MGSAEETQNQGEAKPKKRTDGKMDFEELAEMYGAGDQEHEEDSEFEEE